MHKQFYHFIFSSTSFAKKKQHFSRISQRQIENVPFLNLLFPSATAFIGAREINQICDFAGFGFFLRVFSPTRQRTCTSVCVGCGLCVTAIENVSSAFLCGSGAFCRAFSRDYSPFPMLSQQMDDLGEFSRYFVVIANRHNPPYCAVKRAR